LRWLQFGAVAPIFRTHCDHCERRIWLFPHFPWMKDAMLFRNALVPYLYTAAFSHFQTGIAPIHPLYYHWPMDQNTYNYMSQYMFGSSIIASPIVQVVDADGMTTKEVYLPEGVWVNWNGSKVYSGPTTTSELYGVQDIPIYVDCSAVVPMRDMNSVVSSFADPITWVIWGCATSGAGILYEDDGDSLDYLTNQNPATTSVTYALVTNPQQIAVKVEAVDGSFPGMPDSRSHIVQVRGWGYFMGSGPSMVMCNDIMVNPGNSVPGWYVSPTHSLATPEWTLVIACGLFAVNQPLNVVISYTPNGTTTQHSP